MVVIQIHDPFACLLSNNGYMVSPMGEYFIEHTVRLCYTEQQQGRQKIAGANVFNTEHFTGICSGTRREP
jgi:hypothetical protein